MKWSNWPTFGPDSWAPGNMLFPWLGCLISGAVSDQIFPLCGYMPYLENSTWSCIQLGGAGECPPLAHLGYEGQLNCNGSSEVPMELCFHGQICCYDKEVGRSESEEWGNCIQHSLFWSGYNPSCSSVGIGQTCLVLFVLGEAYLKTGIYISLLRHLLSWRHRAASNYPF